MVNPLRVEDRDFAFRNRLQTFSIVNEEHIELNQFFQNAYEHFEPRVSALLRDHYLIKVSSCFVANFEKSVPTEEGVRTESQKMYINTRAEVVDFETDIRSFYDENIVNAIDQKIDDVQLRGSGFALTEIIELNIQLSSFDPCSGSSYIPLPQYLQSKHAIINVKNNDDQCFKYAVLSAIFPVQKDGQRVSKYTKHIDSLNFTNMRYPVDLKQITKFEQQNPTISINVYMFDDQTKKIRTLRLTKDVKTNHIHLLLPTETSKNGDDEPRSHYCWIKNLSALLSAQVRKK